RLTRSAVRRLAYQDAVDRSSRLQPRRRVDHVSRGHSLSALGTSVEVDEGFACIDGDSHLDVLVVARPVADRNRRTHRALWVILVRDRRTEQRHHRIADELLYRAAEPFELAPQALVVRIEN